eukprot:9349528-Pyramimonas_sp.AAC.1
MFEQRNQAPSSSKTDQAGTSDGERTCTVDESHVQPGKRTWWGEKHWPIDEVTGSTYLLCAHTLTMKHFPIFLTVRALRMSLLAAARQDSSGPWWPRTKP